MIKSYWYCFISLKWKLYSLRPKIYQALQHHIIWIDYIYSNIENGATQFFWLKLITGNWESFPKNLYLSKPLTENCTVLRTQTYNRSLSYMDKTDVNLCLNNAVTFSIIDSMLRQTDMLWQTNPNAQCYYILIHAWTML